MSDTALFDAAPYTVPAAVVEPGETLSAGRRLTLRQAAQLAKGIHPISHGRLHPDAAPHDNRQAAGLRCRTCHFHAVVGGHARAYPKCKWPNVDAYRYVDLPRVSGGPATDCRGWFPACVDYKPREEI